MSRLLWITYSLLLTIWFTDGQTVQSPAPVESCVATTLTIRCSNGYVPVVRNAFLGVSKVGNLCNYSPGDCTADAMSLIVYSGDLITQNIYATKKKLPQCADQFASYLNVEYECVPISLQDSGREYAACPNGVEITTSNGIIRSPGYPSQFQTTTVECLRSIHVPDDKTIRLWITDLSIGSATTACSNDHVFVVDSVQTFRKCGSLRFAYPYLCSPNILIQYLAKTKLSLYKGMRMYFEVVDRPANDGCPNSNVTLTPIPATTPTITTLEPEPSTPTPSYVLLGIASKVENFQLCKNESKSFSCPNNYGIAFLKNRFGVTTSGLCEQHDAEKYCGVEAEPDYSCRQSCQSTYTGNQQLLNCQNRTATYQYIEYQCIPTNANLIPNNIACPTDGAMIPIRIGRSGRFQSLNYPKLQTMSCNYRLIADPGHIINVYSLDISLNDFQRNCTSNSITFFDDGEQTGDDYCEQRFYSLMHSSCTNELDLRYVVTDASKLISSGFDLYIQSEVRPADWTCGRQSTSTIQTQPMTTPTAKPLTTNDPAMFASAEYEDDICFGKSLNSRCPTGYTFMILDAYYGVRKNPQNTCGFQQGDCVQDAGLSSCTNDVEGCFISFTSQRRLARCSDKYADYLHISSQCVPSRPIGTLTVINICDSDDNIQDNNGVITSPFYPTYQQTNRDCRRTLVGIPDRVLKIWINEMSIASGTRSSSTEETDEPDLVIHKTVDTTDLATLEKMNPSIRDICIQDYLIINAPHVAYVYCGKRKLAISPICAATVTILYRTEAKPLLSYKGFKIYYEWVDNSGNICLGPIDPTLTTTPIYGPLPLWAENLLPSPSLSADICFGSPPALLRCPRGSDYALSLYNAQYGFTGTGVCEIPSAVHCYQEAPLNFPCTQSCTISYDVPKPLTQCANQVADYLKIDYRCIPTRLPNNENPLDICSPLATGTVVGDSGILVSPQYPTLTGLRACSKTIETVPGKLWMIYVVDIFIEGENDFGDCDSSSLTIFDGNEKIIRCGLHQPELVHISCSNVVQFNFIATHTAVGYRGFKLYYKTIDATPDWACNAVFPNGTTIPTPTTTQPTPTTTLNPPSLQIAAFGGTTNGTRQYCVFPFIYNGREQTTCLTSDPPGQSGDPEVIQPWCSINKNCSTDCQWGFCDLGVTESTFYDICRSQTQSLRCPSGYLIDIITANYAAKPDGSIGAGSCAYNQNDCFQSDASTVQNTCAGKPSCTAIHFIKTLASCQNRPSAYLHINYNCIPNTVQGIPTYNLCDNTTVLPSNAARGYIISPSFPSTPSNLDCTFNLQTVRPHQDIYLYALDMDLNTADTIGQSCNKDRLIIRADNSVRELCGRSYTDLLINTCHASISLQLIRASDAKGKGVKFYFEFRERLPDVVCVPLVTTTTGGPAVSTSTNAPVLPSYFPEPSPRLFKTLCYLDLSGLFGVNNFQCPANYVIVIHRALYGKGSSCDYRDGDCITEADIVYRTCSGKQGCSVTFLTQITLPECNKAVANYLFVEYQCLPTPAIAQNVGELCKTPVPPVDGLSGILHSPNYPVYTSTQCSNVTLSSFDGSNMVLFLYVLDLSIGETNPSTGACQNDYLSLFYQCNGVLYSQQLCGTSSTKLLFDTCSATDKIFASYQLSNTDPQSQRGFALLYHLVPYVTFNITTPRTSTTSTTSTSTTTTLIPGPGPVSTSIESVTTCVLQSRRMQCQTGYALIIHKIYLFASANGVCNYDPDDCYEDRTNQYNYCAGLTICTVFASQIPIAACNGSRSTHLYTEHQCIPVRPKLNLDVCSSGGTPQRVEGGAVISTGNYTAVYQQCDLQMQSNPLLGAQVHRAFKIFILSLKFPIQLSLAREQGAQCRDDNPYIEIDDPEEGVTRLCGSSHSRYLLETCSNTINVRFRNFLVDTGPARFPGAQLYFESIINDKCRVEPTVTPIPPSPPLEIGNRVACAGSIGRDRVTMGCTAEHGLIILQSYRYATKQPAMCDISEHTCHYPSAEPRLQCSGQQSCTYVYRYPLAGTDRNCPSGISADAVQFFYQCIPMRPSLQYPKTILCQASTITDMSGIIETANYPESYRNEPQQCSLRLPLPADNNVKQYSVHLYVIDLSMRDNPMDTTSQDVACVDSLTYSDGIMTKQLCGVIDQPVLIYSTNKRDLNLTLSLTGPSGGLMANWRGARLFYHIGSLALPEPPKPINPVITTPRPLTPSSTTSKAVTSSKPVDDSKDKGNHSGVIAGVIIGCLLFILIIVGLIYYRRRSMASSGAPGGMIYDPKTDQVRGSVSNGTMMEHRSSIPSAALKGPSATSTSIVSPFFNKQKEATVTVNAEEQTTDA